MIKKPLILLAAVLSTTVALGGSAAGNNFTDLVNVDPAGLPGRDPAESPSISADGRFVAFVSAGTDLLRRPLNGLPQVFVRDMLLKRTDIVSLGPDGRIEGSGGSVGPTISADGRFVAFVSDASNLVPGDTNGTFDVFVKDRKSKRVERANVSSTGRQANGFTFKASISTDGRFVAFNSLASNLVVGDTNRLSDVFVHDRRLGLTQRVSVGRNGLQANGGSLSPSISAGGGSVAFESAATNLVIGHPGLVRGMFVHRRAGFTREISVGPAGEQGDSDSRDAAISADGRFVAFVSSAGNLVAGVGGINVYLRGPRHP